jgi:hypothetical protein
MDVATVARSCFKNNAHEMMVHMLMWMHRCKANTWGVTQAGVLGVSVAPSSSGAAAGCLAICYFSVICDQFVKNLMIFVYNLAYIYLISAIHRKNL